MSAGPLPDVISTITAMGGAVMQFAVPLAVFGWWLSGRFRQVEAVTAARIEALAKISIDQLQTHEERDQGRQEETMRKLEQSADRGAARHEDNQKRFEMISVSLAKLGANGR